MSTHNANPIDAHGLPVGYPFKPEYEVTPRDAKSRLVSGADILLVDCRTPEEFALVRIPGSINVPLDQLDRRVDDITDEVKPGQQVAVICHHGVRSMRATLFLRSVGKEVPELSNAVSVAGGIDAWSLGADTTVPRYERSSGQPKLIP